MPDPAVVKTKEEAKPIRREESGGVEGLWLLEDSGGWADDLEWG